MTNAHEPHGEPIGEFDETNGLAGNLDGDDGGAESTDNDETVFGGLLTNVLDPDADQGENTGETSYSEEGRP